MSSHRVSRNAPRVVTRIVPPMSSHTPDPAAEPRRRGVDPLSQATRRHLLAKLLAAAEGGDHQAAGVLLELGAAAERDEAIAATLRELRGEGGAP